MILQGDVNVLDVKTIFGGLRARTGVDKLFQTILRIRHQLVGNSFRRANGEECEMGWPTGRE